MKLLVSPTFITPERACWKRLTALVIDGLLPLSVISLCVNLSSLEMNNSTNSRVTEPTREPPIILSKLKKLIMNFFPVTLLRSLSLPDLITLKIDSDNHVSITEPFPPFPSLASLELKGRFSVDPSCFIAPDLTSLKILGSRQAGSGVITPRHYSEWPYPSLLEKLELDSLVDATDVVVAMLGHHANLTSINMTYVASTPSVIKSLWRRSFGGKDVQLLCPSLQDVTIKYRSVRYKQVAILGMLQTLAMARESADIPLSKLSFQQYRHGNSSLREILPLPVERQDDDSDSDQSTCEACRGYHG